MTASKGGSSAMSMQDVLKLHFQQESKSKTVSADAKHKGEVRRRKEDVLQQIELENELKEVWEL